VLGEAINEAVRAASIIRKWPAALTALCNLLARLDPSAQPADDGTQRVGPVKKPSIMRWGAMSTKEFEADDMPLLEEDEVKEALSKLLRATTVNMRSAGAALGTLANSAISALLCCSVGLSTLDVSKCNLDREQPGGGAAIAKALMRTKTLTSINLASNELIPASGEALCVAVREHGSLRNLSVANNLFGAPLRMKMKDVVENSASLSTVRAASPKTMRCQRQ
jgi:hypothetical protein